MNSSIEEFMMLTAIQCGNFDTISHVYNLICMKNKSENEIEKTEEKEFLPSFTFEYRPPLYDESGMPIYERPFSTQQARGEICVPEHFYDKEKMEMWMLQKTRKEWHDECAKQNDIKLADEAMKRNTEWRKTFVRS